METSFFDFSVIRKLKCYEKKQFEQENTVKNHFATSTATQIWMPRDIILQFLFTHMATVNWMYAVMRDGLCIHFMHTWKRTFFFWYIFIFNAIEK